MTQAPLRALAWLRTSVEGALALMMAAMFSAFILQIVFRYFINLPVGWTEEVCVIAWIWGILWGAGFVTRDSEDVRFDMLYSAVSRPAKRAFTVVSSTAIVAILVWSLPAAWSYVAFMKVEKTASLGIPLNWLFSIYIAFALATIVRHGRLAIQALRDRLLDDRPPAEHPVEDL